MSGDINYREMFQGAIKLQEELIADAVRRIEHYRWALEEMDRQENIIEPVDPKMLALCKAIVQDCA